MIKKWIKRFRLTEKPPVSDGVETQYWMRWDKNAWRTLNEHGVGPNGHGRDWELWTERDWNNKLIEKVWEMKTWMLRESRHLMEHDLTRLTVSPEVLMVLESHPSLATSMTMPEDGPDYYLGGVFSIHVDYYQHYNRLYIGCNDEPKKGCIVIDNINQYGNTQETEGRDMGVL